MSLKYIQPGDVLDLTAPSGGVVAGSAYLIGAALVVALSTAAEGAAFPGQRVGVWTLAKETGAAWTIGQRLYWDNGNARFTGDAIDGALYGVAMSAAASGDAVGNVLLLGGVPGVLEGPQAHIPDLNLTTLTDSPATADALRDNLTATWEAELEAKLNAILAALRTVGILASS